MKVSIVPSGEPPPPIVRIELSVEEADKLAWLMGSDHAEVVNALAQTYKVDEKIGDAKAVRKFMVAYYSALMEALDDVHR